MKRGTLFVRSGGGLPGLDIHCGIWLALEQAGIRADANSGTSAGAAVAALDSAGWSAADAKQLLSTLHPIAYC
jgi:predicted acylesterase/phospholipase RssA